jgi:hypothetical protein
MAYLPLGYQPSQLPSQQLKTSSTPSSISASAVLQAATKPQVLMLLLKPIT